MCTEPLANPPTNQTTSPPMHPRYKDWFGPGHNVHPITPSVSSLTTKKGHASPFNKHPQPIFQHKVIRSHILTNKITVDIPILGECDINRILTLLHNLTLHDDTLLGIKNFYDNITLSLTKSINQDSAPNVPDLHQVDPTTTWFDLMVPPESSTNLTHAYQTYLMFARALSKSIPNSTKIYAVPFAYKSLQYFTTHDDDWSMLEHFIIHRDPHLGGKVDDP